MLRAWLYNWWGWLLSACGRTRPIEARTSRLKIDIRKSGGRYKYACIGGDDRRGNVTTHSKGSADNECWTVEFEFAFRLSTLIEFQDHDGLRITRPQSNPPVFPGEDGESFPLQDSGKDPDVFLLPDGLDFVATQSEDRRTLRLRINRGGDYNVEYCLNMKITPLFGEPKRRVLDPKVKNTRT